MAKKKGSTAGKFVSGVKRLVSEYKSKAMFMVVEFIEREAVNIITWMKDMMKIKQMIRKFIVSTIMILAAVIVLVLGIANYAAELSGVSVGLMQIIVGVVLIIIAMVYKKT